MISRTADIPYPLLLPLYLQEMKRKNLFLYDGLIGRRVDVDTESFIRELLGFKFPFFSLFIDGKIYMGEALFCIVHKIKLTNLQTEFV